MIRNPKCVKCGKLIIGYYKPTKRVCSACRKAGMRYIRLTPKIRPCKRCGKMKEFHHGLEKYCGKFSDIESCKHINYLETLFRYKNNESHRVLRNEKARKKYFMNVIQHRKVRQCRCHLCPIHYDPFRSEHSI